MRYVALATDYDGTLAHDGVVATTAIEALERLAHSGRKLILVTGRELPDLQRVFPRLDLFEKVVAENGALLYTPATREKRTLAQRPPDQFIDALRRRGVTNMSAGEVIVALWRPQEEIAIKAIAEFGLELQVIFNKDAVMILPSGVNKSTGLEAALDELRISRHNLAGIGDAENDHSFLSCCECAVAVANAISALKEKADLVTKGDHGAGVVELAGMLLQDDLAGLNVSADRAGIRLGKAGDREIVLKTHGQVVLVCGQSGSGKSTFVTGVIERVAERGYQICLVDPEGDYGSLSGFVATGDTGHPPSLDHLRQMLDDPKAQVTVNLAGVRIPDRAAAFASALSLIQERQVHLGRPHWLVVDEAHQMLPSEWSPARGQLGGEIPNLLLLTVHPQHVAPAALKRVDTVIVMGAEPAGALEEFGNIAGVRVPVPPSDPLEHGEALLWQRDGGAVLKMTSDPPRAERDRHKRKYAAGDIEEDRVFYFRGPDGKLNLRAQNLTVFLQMADGVDDETWLFHLHRGDYSRWLREDVKDKELADHVAAIERDDRISPGESRKRIREAIEEKYTAPA
ncbi:MAG TPA: HAD-IIB family hydrolase [Bryobacteraceae bacterium]|nr:HAD-IIB family hydrolase [Bryobacteraceae bacterium]